MDDARSGEAVELGREECLRLLASASLGRVAVSVPGWAPLVRPVGYVYDVASSSVVFRSVRGSKLTALVLAGEAAFEVDGVEESGRGGWSGIVVGAVEEVTSAAEVRRLATAAVPLPGGAGNDPHWLRIRPNAVSGRRLALVS